MRELIRDNKQILMAISRFDIAYGFGEKSVDEICTANNVDTGTFLAVCNTLSGHIYKEKIALSSLMSYLKRAHSNFLDYTLPKIRHNLIDAINYSDTNEMALLLIRFFDDYVEEVRKHMDYENDVVFEYARNLMEGKIDENFQLSDFSENHGHMTAKLQELKDIFICHYEQKDNIRLSSVLFEIITAEQDFMSHFEIERTLFIPAIQQLEDSVRDRIENVDEVEDNGSADIPCSILSNREKDIVIGIAKGLSNKEIADRLYLSVNTVTTHRRNICAKLNIHSTAGVTIFAVLHHLVSLDEVNPMKQS